MKQCAGRIIAGILAAIGWLGLAQMLWLQASAPGWNLGWALYWNTMFFSDLGNLCAAVVLAGFAAGVPRLSTARMLGLALLCMLLIFGFNGLNGFAYFGTLGGRPFGDLAMHAILPIGVPLFWLTLAPHGGTRWRDLIVWVGFPLCYLAYALARGAPTGDYPYPWIDPREQGYGPVLIFAAIVAGIFIVAGALVVGLDHLLGRRAAPKPEAS